MKSKPPFADLSDEPLLNIKAVAQATGIEPVTLRAWERRYGVPKPGRADQGYRLYSEREVAILQWLKSKVDAGVSIKRAVAMLHHLLDQQNHEPVLASPFAEGQGSFESAVDELIAAVHDFDSERAQQVMMQAFALFPVEDVCLKLLLPTLARIGEQWRAAEASLQVEHFATHLIRQRLLALMATLPPPSLSGRVVAGCAPGDWHEMGILVLSLLLRRQGWDVIYLGQAVGLSELGDTLSAIGPDGVILSSSCFQTVRQLPTAAELIMRTSGGRIWFAYGGSLFGRIPHLSERIPGIFLGSTLDEALYHTGSLLSGTRQPEPNQPSGPTPETMALLEALDTAMPSLIGDLSHLLLGVSSLTPEASVEMASEQLAALMVTIQFDMPELLIAPANLLEGALKAQGISQDQLRSVFERYITPDLIRGVEPLLGYL
jgi:DNA-binding transcriptional MerR regulator